jgi:tetratricopeptide (TPR) repeat protein
LKSPQFIAIGVAIAAFLALYLWPSRVPEIDNRYDILADSALTAMPAEQAERIRSLEAALEKALKRSSPDGEAKGLYAQLDQAWQAEGLEAVAAEQARLAANLEPLEADAYGAVGDRFMALIPTAGDDQERVDYVFRAIHSYEEALELNPEDLDRKVGLATLYTDHQGNIMQGVMLLREVAAADSTNSEAQMRLGRFSLMSGQVDKALGRFRTVVRQDSLNLPARILLAQTLANAGREGEAIKELQEGLVLAPDSTSRIEITRLLEDLDPDL